MELNGITDIARFLIDESAAQQALADLRWPEGKFVCPLCDHEKVYETSYETTARGKTTVRKQWKCASCRKKFSVTSARFSKAPKSRSASGSTRST